MEKLLKLGLEVLLELSGGFTLMLEGLLDKGVLF